MNRDLKINSWFNKQVQSFKSCLLYVYLVTNPSNIFVQGLGKLSVVAASAAQSAASVVQAGTKELTTKVF